MRASQTTADEIETTDDNVILDVAGRHFKRIKVRCRTADRDALVLPSGCRDVTIDRLEIDTWTQDGVKVQNAGTPARNVSVLGGYVRGHAKSAAAHQDGIQTMGGEDLLFRDVAWDHVGGGGGNLFIAQGGSGAGTPTGMVFERCAMGPSHPNQIRFYSGSGHKLLNCLVYRPYSGRAAIAGSAPFEESGTILRNPVPIEEAWAACLAYVGAGTEPAPPVPPPSPEPPPPPLDPCDTVRAELETVRSLYIATSQEVVTLRAVIAQSKLKEAEIDRILAAAAAEEIVP